MKLQAAEYSKRGIRVNLSFLFFSLSGCPGEQKSWFITELMAVFAVKGVSDQLKDWESAMAKRIKASIIERFRALHDQSTKYGSQSVSASDSRASGTSTGVTDLKNFVVTPDSGPKMGVAEFKELLAAGGFGYAASEKTQLVGLNDMSGAQGLLYVQISPHKYGEGFKDDQGQQVTPEQKQAKTREYRQAAIARLKELHRNERVVILALGTMNDKLEYDIAQTYEEEQEGAQWQHVSTGTSELQRNDNVLVYHSNVKSHSEFYWGDDDLDMMLDLYDLTIAQNKPLSIHCTDGLDRAGAVSFGFILFQHRDEIFQADPRAAEEALLRLLSQARDDRSPGYCQEKAVGAAISLASAMTAIQKQRDAQSRLRLAYSGVDISKQDLANLKEGLESQQSRAAKRLPGFIRRRTKVGKKIAAIDECLQAEADVVAMKKAFFENCRQVSDEKLEQQAELRQHADGQPRGQSTASRISEPPASPADPRTQVDEERQDQSRASTIYVPLPVITSVPPASPAELSSAPKTRESTSELLLNYFESESALKPNPGEGERLFMNAYAVSKQILHSKRERIQEDQTLSRLQAKIEQLEPIYQARSMLEVPLSEEQLNMLHAILETASLDKTQEAQQHDALYFLRKAIRDKMKGNPSEERFKQQADFNDENNLKLELFFLKTLGRVIENNPSEVAERPNLKRGFMRRLAKVEEHIGEKNALSAETQMAYQACKDMRTRIQQAPGQTPPTTNYP